MGNVRAAVVQVYTQGRERGVSHETAVGDALIAMRANGRTVASVDAETWVSSARSMFETSAAEQAKADAAAAAASHGDMFATKGAAAERAAAQAAWADEVVEREVVHNRPPRASDTEEVDLYAMRGITHRAQGGDNLETASAPARRGGWEFDEHVTQAFDDMLRRSIPNYADMRHITALAARQVLKGRKGPKVVDLGSSRGEAVAPLVDALGAQARFGLAELSPPMLAVLRERFKGYVAAGVMQIMEWDLRQGMPFGNVDVALCVLTLQFVPIEYRQRLLWECCENLKPGGALILVEKVLGESHPSQQLMTELYEDRKRGNGYEQEAIERKRLALEGVLVPLPAATNEAWLRAAGFASVECIWAWANFRGWVAVKR